MELKLLVLGVLVLLVLGHRLFGARVARRLGLDDGRRTPAHAKRDGVDFVPTPPFYLFAQHFSAIAAAGPIAGPILAAQQYGWLPCLLWIGVGVVFIGAVHDMTTLVASLRHGGESIAAMARQRLGTGAGRAMTLFILLALVYVIVAFADITAGSFASGSEELAGGTARFNPGGAVAAAGTGFLLLALLLGLVERLLKPPLWLVTVVFVPALLALIHGATKISHLLVLDARSWALLIFAYCAVASLLPVRVLLQPRGYLGGIVLYAALGVAVLGLLFGDFAIHQPAFKGWDAGGAATMFPFLFVTIACGACSGFHGLVCSGTTSKQLDKETHAHPVGYGAMLAEGFVAVVALSALLVLEPAQMTGADGKPLPAGALYGRGMGEFLATLIGREHLEFAITFGAMAFSTFVFDTLDVATRLGRYLVQELLGWKGVVGALVGVAVVVVAPAALHWAEDEGAFLRFWTLFGASNQLLAALTFICLAVWLKQEGRPTWFVLLPLGFILSITTWALGALLASNLRAAQGFDARAANALVAGLLLALAATMVVAGWRSWRAAAGRTAN